MINLKKYEPKINVNNTINVNERLQKQLINIDWLDYILYGSIQDINECTNLKKDGKYGYDNIYLEIARLLNTIDDRLEAMVNYYEHENFLDNYIYGLDLNRFLYEDGIFNELVNNYYDTDFSIEETNLIMDFIQNDLRIERYTNYYVGEGEVFSCYFGEQEESVSDFIDYLDYKSDVLPEDFVLFLILLKLDNSDYYLNNSQEYLYYDLSSEGIQVNLSSYKLEELKEYIKEQED